MQLLGRPTAAVITALLLVSSAASADVTWTTADGYESCTPPLVTSCAVTASAHAGGSASISIAISSRAQGYAPAVGDAVGSAQFRLVHTLAQDAAAMTVDATLHVAQATVAAVRRLGGLVPGPFGSVSAAVHVSPPCAGCFTVGGVTVLEEPGSVTDQDFDFSMIVHPFDGVIPAGDVLIEGYVEVRGSMGLLGAGVGTLSGSFDGALTITGVDVTPA